MELPIHRSISKGFPRHKYRKVRTDAYSLTGCFSRLYGWVMGAGGSLVEKQSERERRMLSAFESTDAEERPLGEVRPVKETAGFSVYVCLCLCETDFNNYRRRETRRWKGERQASGFHRSMGSRKPASLRRRIVCETAGGTT